MKTNLNMRQFLAISAVALTLPVTALAFGRDDNQGRRGGNDRPAMEMRHGGGMPNLRGIDLSADQVSALTKMRDERRSAAMGQRQAMREQHDALKKLVMSDAYTPAAAQEIIARIGAKRDEMAMRNAEQGNQLYKILTPEQRTKMQQNDLTGRGGKWHGHRG